MIVSITEQYEPDDTATNPARNRSPYGDEQNRSKGHSRTILE